MQKSIGIVIFAKSCIKFNEKDVVRMEAGPGSSHNRSKNYNKIETAMDSFCNMLITWNVQL